jgi:hypothetical protein
VTSLNILHSSFTFAEILTLESLQLLSHLAIATLSQLVLLLHASFALACNLITCQMEECHEMSARGRHTRAQKDSMSTAAVTFASKPGKRLFNKRIAL